MKGYTKMQHSLQVYNNTPMPYALQKNEIMQRFANPITNIQ